MKEQIILDVRSHEEHNQEHIKWSIDMPLSYIESREAKVAKLLKWKQVLIMCRTGRRAELAQQILAPHSEIESLKVYKWGILEYKKEHPEEMVTWKNSSRIPIMRQVLIAAGSLVLTFLLLGYFVSPAFLLWVLFVSGWLMFSGISGNCLMATILWKMPFNT